MSSLSTSPSPRVANATGMLVGWLAGLLWRAGGRLRQVDAARAALESERRMRADDCDRLRADSAAAATAAAAAAAAASAEAAGLSAERDDLAERCGALHMDAEGFSAEAARLRGELNTSRAEVRRRRVSWRAHAAHPSRAACAAVAGRALSTGLRAV